MAIRIPKIKILSTLTNFLPQPLQEDSVDVAGKIYRAKILYDRNFRGFEKDTSGRLPNAYEHEATSTNRIGQKPYQREILTNRRGRTQDIPADSYTSETPGQRVVRSVEKDYVSIIDIDYQPSEDDAKKYYSSLRLPFVPEVLNYNPQSNFVGLASFGRNNPYYHYAGSEDILTFTIDWFSAVNNRTDVIFYCKWLESLTKGDGYDDTPHRVILSWGRENLLFDNSIWLVTSAPYDLSQFINSYDKGGQNFKVGLLPQQAYQKVTLKRITENNRTTAEIVGNRPILN